MIHTVLLSMFLLQSLNEQRFCADAARQYVREEYPPNTTDIILSNYTTHYNTRLNRCLAKIESLVTASDGDKKLTLKEITITDVLKRMLYANYLYFLQQKRVSACRYYDVNKLDWIQCGPIPPEEFRKRITPLMVD